MNESVIYEIWGKSADKRTIPFLRLRNTLEFEGEARKEYERLVKKFPKDSFSLVKVTRKKLEQHHGEV